MLFQFTNGGRPAVQLQDANHANRSELLLVHNHVGVDLRLDWAREVLGSLVRIWKRPVRLDTIMDGRRIQLGHDGEKPTEESLESEKEAAAS